jgi:hypothetical protein
VLNPDFQNNMKKIGQSSGSPAGLMAWRRVKTGYNSVPILFG